MLEVSVVVGSGFVLSWGGCWGEGRERYFEVFSCFLRVIGRFCCF